MIWKIRFFCSWKSVKMVASLTFYSNSRRRIIAGNLMDLCCTIDQTNGAGNVQVVHNPLWGQQTIFSTNFPSHQWIIINLETHKFYEFAKSDLRIWKVVFNKIFTVMNKSADKAMQPLPLINKSIYLMSVSLFLINQ